MPFGTAIHLRNPGADRAEAVIGSAESCDIRILDDPGVSPRHAKVVRAVGRNPANGCPGIFEVFDLGSTNGTFIARRDLILRCRLGGFITLLPGDVICVGRTRLPWTGAAE